MERYLDDEHIDVKVLIEDLEKAVARGSFYPVLAVAAPQGIGIAELLEVMTEAFPAPGRAPAARGDLAGRQAGDQPAQRPGRPAAGRGDQDRLGPYVGRISLVRVFSGTLRPDGVVHVSGHGRAEHGHADHDQDERLGALTSPLGKQQRGVAQCSAGDICAVAKLGSAETGDSLSDKDTPLLMEPWAMPEPLLPIAITAKSKADEDKMSQALGRLVAEDPTLRLENNAETRQLVLWCMGEAHADLLLDRLSSRYGVAVETTPLRVPLRETVGGKARRAGPERQADRRPRRVRHLPDRGGAAAVRLRPRVHRQDRRRGGAAAVHPLGREGHPRPDGVRRAGGLPDGGHQGHPVRRQGARGGLLRHGVPEGRPGRAAGRGRARRRCCCSSPWTRFPCWSPTTTSAR